MCCCYCLYPKRYRWLRFSNLPSWKPTLIPQNQHIKVQTAPTWHLQNQPATHKGLSPCVGWRSCCFCYCNVGKGGLVERTQTGFAFLNQLQSFSKTLFSHLWNGDNNSLLPTYKFVLGLNLQNGKPPPPASLQSSWVGVGESNKEV